MGAVSTTGDRLGLSARAKAMFAASVVKSLNMSVEDTNISYSTAARKGKTARFNTEETIKSSYVPPDNVVLHWDGKVVKLKAGQKAEFICVYISGGGDTKLLGVPEVESGTG